MFEIQCNGLSCVIGRLGKPKSSKFVLICQERAQSGFLVGTTSQRMYCWICVVIQGQCWLETRDSQIPTNAIPVHIQLLSTLGILATGTFQREVGDISGISQPSMSRTMPVVLDAIISLAPNYIQFPYRDPQQAKIKRGFHAIAGFPNIIEAINCTHIAIKAQSTKEFNYVNRKGFHSVNVQIVCDANLSFLNVVARQPGGTHDSIIMQNSSVGLCLQEGAVEDGWLLGEYQATACLKYYCWVMYSC